MTQLSSLHVYCTATVTDFQGWHFDRRKTSRIVHRSSFEKKINVGIWNPISSTPFKAYWVSILHCLHQKSWQCNLPRALKGFKWSWHLFPWAGIFDHYKLYLNNAFNFLGFNQKKKEIISNCRSALCELIWSVYEHYDQSLWIYTYIWTWRSFYWRKNTSLWLWSSYREILMNSIKSLEFTNINCNCMNCSWYHPFVFHDAFLQSSEREQMSGRV